MSLNKQRYLAELQRLLVFMTPDDRDRTVRRFSYMFDAAGPEGEAALGVEPILFGVLVMGWDMLFLGCKRMIKSIVSDARNSAGQKNPTAKK